MRTLVLLAVPALLAACELEPPPKKAPPVPTAAPVATTETVTVDAGAPEDAGVPVRPPADAVVITAACNAVGVHVADTLIAGAIDAAIKADLTQQRSRIVLRTSETCTRDAWPEASIKCFAQAKTPEEMQVCGQNLAAPVED